MTPLQTPQQSLRVVKSIVDVLRNLCLRLFHSLQRDTA
jgi:hypothetical protein